jgi:hypothetical protein
MKAVISLKSTQKDDSDNYNKNSTLIKSQIGIGWDELIS